MKINFRMSNDYIEQVDILMNNAGVFSTKDWKLMNDINNTGAVIGTMMAVER